MKLNELPAKRPKLQNVVYNARVLQVQLFTRLTNANPADESNNLHDNASPGIQPPKLSQLIRSQVLAHNHGTKPTSRQAITFFNY